MRHDISLKGQRFGLRPATVEDAAFILSLRLDPRLNRYLHETSPRIEDQIAWQREYEERAGDYYFIIEDLKLDEGVGTIGVYDIDPVRRGAEWGRWIVKPSSMAAVESVALMADAAFEHLDLEAVVSRTIVENRQVVSFHDSFGAVRNRLLKNAVTVHGSAHDMVEHKLDRSRWSEIKPRILQLASRTAAL